MKGYAPGCRRMLDESEDGTFWRQIEDTTFFFSSRDREENRDCFLMAFFMDQR